MSARSPRPPDAWSGGPRARARRFQGPGRFYAGPAVAYGRIFIGNVNGRILGLNATTGAINWVRVVGDYVYSSAAVADRMVFVGSYDRTLYALDAVTGDVVWHQVPRAADLRIAVGAPAIWCGSRRSARR